MRSTPNKLRAAELAAKTIEKTIDPAAPSEERAQRRRRLTSAARAGTADEMVKPSAFVASANSNRYLSPNFDRPAGQDMEVTTGIVSGSREIDEQFVLPMGHLGVRRGSKRSARQEERRAHNIKF